MISRKFLAVAGMVLAAAVGTVLPGAGAPALAQQVAGPQPAAGQPGITAGIRSGMEVVGSDNAHVGAVTDVLSNTLDLTSQDPAAHGAFHAIPAAWIASVDDKVHLNVTADQAHQQWQVTSHPAPH